MSVVKDCPCSPFENLTKWSGWIIVHDRRQICLVDLSKHCRYLKDSSKQIQQSVWTTCPISAIQRTKDHWPECVSESEIERENPIFVRGEQQMEGSI